MESNLNFEGDYTEIFACSNDDDSCLHIGTHEQFVEWVYENEDLSDYFVGYEMDKDDIKPSPCYKEYWIEDFMNADYYMKFYEHQKAHCKRPAPLIAVQN